MPPSGVEHHSIEMSGHCADYHQSNDSDYQEPERKELTGLRGALITMRHRYQSHLPSTYNEEGHPVKVA